MARAFAHKCQYYFDLYEQSGRSDYVYTSEDHEHYQEPEYIVALGTLLIGRALHRHQWLRELRHLLA